LKKCKGRILNQKNEKGSKANRFRKDTVERVGGKEKKSSSNKQKCHKTKLILVGEGESQKSALYRDGPHEGRKGDKKKPRGFSLKK